MKKTDLLKLHLIKRTDPNILKNMTNHYSNPKGFVGRNICYEILFDGKLYGHIVGGSATKFLPGRDEFLGYAKLNNIVNNIFFHIEPSNNKYPLRNFTTKVVLLYEKYITRDWPHFYSDEVFGFETLVELPRTGELYKKAGYTVVGETKGYTCKRTSGNSSDSWSGKRIWNTIELRPKLVLCKKSINFHKIESLEQLDLL